MPSCWNARYAGKSAFAGTDKDGYGKGKVDGATYSAHRVAFAIFHGYWPAETIDHINGDPADNRPENLRQVSHTDNVKNRCVSNNTFTGQIGINKCSGSKNFRVRLAGQAFGTYTNLEDAMRVRDQKLTELGFHPNHGRAKRSAA